MQAIHESKWCSQWTYNHKFSRTFPEQTFWLWFCHCPSESNLNLVDPGCCQSGLSCEHSRRKSDHLGLPQQPHCHLGGKWLPELSGWRNPHISKDFGCHIKRVENTAKVLTIWSELNHFFGSSANKDIPKSEGVIPRATDEHWMGWSEGKTAHWSLMPS